jgi:hypothetical protein
VLTIDGELAPVQWRSYHSALKRYHGTRRRAISASAAPLDQLAQIRPNREPLATVSSVRAWLLDWLLDWLLVGSSPVIASSQFARRFIRVAAVVPVPTSRRKHPALPIERLPTLPTYG